MFDTLKAHGRQWRKQDKSKVGCFYFHYVPCAEEPAAIDATAMRESSSNSSKNDSDIDINSCDSEFVIHAAVRRPKSKPQITAITGIRSNFSFKAMTGKRLSMRQLSCHCDPCLAGKQNACNNKEAGAWNTILMVKRPGATAVTQRALVSKARRALALQCQVNDFVALESNDDADGFQFWLARVQKVAFKHEGKRHVKDGVDVRPGGWYITVVMYERFPLSSEHTFKTCEDEWTIDCEGVVLVGVAYTVCDRGRPAKVPKTVRLANEEIERIENECAIRLNP